MSQLIQTVSRDHSVALEKIGVIAGFIAGLSLGVNLVGQPLSDLGAPTWLAVVAVIPVVAMFTRAGLGLGRRLAGG